MTDSSDNSKRFTKPRATRDFTRPQFELIQSSHEWEKLRAHAQREREMGDPDLPSPIEMPPPPDREPSDPTSMPKPKRPTRKTVVSQKPISDTE